MHRFFVPPDWIDYGKVILRGGLAQQLWNVLRLKPGDEITLLDNSGREYRVRLEKLEKDQAEGSIVDQSPGHEPTARIALYQALLKGERFEFVLQKGTEIGVSDFIPLKCERCVAGEPGEAKLERWRRIIREAAEQCGRARLPQLSPPLPLEEACQMAPGRCLLAWEGERGKGLKDYLGELRSSGRLEESREFSLFIGPEGGFSQREVQAAEDHGVMPVSLGRRILRAETAGLVAAAVILYELGELG